MIADVGENHVDPLPDRVDAVSEPAGDAIPWRFENQLETLVDVAMLIAIPALFFMAMMAVMVPL